MKELNVINIGISGFPLLKTAPVHKCIYLNKSIVKAGIKSFVINNEAVITSSGNKVVNLQGSHDNIEYRYTLSNAIKPNGPIKRKISKNIGLLNEFFFLIKYKFKIGIDFAIFFTNGSFCRLIYHRVLSKLLNYKIILVYHEYRSDFISRKKYYFRRLNDKLFDNYFYLFVDGIFPISEFLIKHIENKSPKLPILKIPPLIDFELFNVAKSLNEPYFLYCGSIGFLNTIKFILESFDKIKTQNNYKLCLVVGGNEAQLQKLKKIIKEHPKQNQIELYSGLSFDKLIELYINAKALLIPLDREKRDIARFPQKIAEYTASANPIISTKFGEVNFYFTDGINALLADDLNADMFAEKLKFVINNPDQAKKIGIEGRKVGMKHFNYLNYSDRIYEFLIQIINQH